MYDKTKIEGYLPLFQILSDIAYERFESVYLVGGFVRDLILERPNKDLDFVVIGDAITYGHEVAEKLNITDIVVFERFGTIHMHGENYDLEFSTARTESYNKDSRKPEIAKTVSLYNDISRRDFTINCMAISLNRTSYLEFIDYFNGIAAIKDGILHTPIDANITFDDDPLRIMRLCRFCAQLGFAPSPLSLSAAMQSYERLSIVSMERISDEFMKIMKSRSPHSGLHLMSSIGIFKYYIPEIEALSDKLPGHKDIWKHTLDVVRKVSKVSKDEWLRVAALFHDIGKPMVREVDEKDGYTFKNHERVGADMLEDIFRRIKFPLDSLPRLKLIISLHGIMNSLNEENVTDAALRRMLVRSQPYFEDLWILYENDYSTTNPHFLLKLTEDNVKLRERFNAIMKKDQLEKEFKLAVNGHDMMEHFPLLKEGKEIGMLKNEAEEAVIQGIVINDKQQILDWLSRKIQDTTQ